MFSNRRFDESYPIGVGIGGIKHRLKGRLTEKEAVWSRTMARHVRGFPFSLSPPQASIGSTRSGLPPEAKDGFGLGSGAKDFISLIIQREEGTMGREVPYYS